MNYQCRLQSSYFSMLQKQHALEQMYRIQQLPHEYPTLHVRALQHQIDPFESSNHVLVC